MVNGGTTGTPIPSEGYNYSYEALPEEARSIVATVWERLADSMDNDERGVWLNEVSGFNKDRMAMLYTLAVSRVNSRLTSINNYTVENIPYTWVSARAALTAALFFEAIKHLMVNYMEIPDVSSVGGAYANRTDYSQKWGSLLNLIDAEFTEHMGAFNRQVLFGGGDTLSGGMTTLIGNSSRFSDSARFGRPIPRTWLGF